MRQEEDDGRDGGRVDHQLGFTHRIPQNISFAILKMAKFRRKKKMAKFRALEIEIGEKWGSTYIELKKFHKISDFFG